jgi:peroxidase
VDRLYPTQDPTLNASFAKKIEETCPTTATVKNTDLDMCTPKVFDKKYYIDLQSGEGLLTSDQDLYNDSRTRHIVNDFATSQSSFFEHFALSMLKMVQLDVLTGSEGEIRKNCAVRNTNSSSSSYSIIDIPVTSHRPPLHATTV